jgi:hypothetical protein
MVYLKKTKKKQQIKEVGGETKRRGRQGRNTRDKEKPQEAKKTANICPLFYFLAILAGVWSHPA